MKADNYQDHKIFAQLTAYAEFYETLTYSVGRWLDAEQDGALILDAYAFSAIHGTLESIRNVLVSRRILDAFALLTKFYDEVIISTYAGLYLGASFGLSNFAVEHVIAWQEGTQLLPELETMVAYIGHSERLQPVNALLYKDDTYSRIWARLAGRLHFQFFQYAPFSENKLRDGRDGLLDALACDAQDIFIMHFAYLFYLNERYMMATDYTDVLDDGEEPEEGSEYFVAPFTQETFDKVVKKHRPDLAAVIKSHTAMELD